MNFIGLIFMVVNPIVASNKGFKWGWWVLSFGCIGLIVLLCLGSAKDPAISEEESIKRGNTASTVGMILTGLNVVLLIGVLAVTLLAVSNQH